MKRRGRWRRMQWRAGTGLAGGAAARRRRRRSPARRPSVRRRRGVLGRAHHAAECRPRAGALRGLAHAGVTWRRAAETLYPPNAENKARYSEDASARAAAGDGWRASGSWHLINADASLTASKIYITLALRLNTAVTRRHAAIGATTCRYGLRRTAERAIIAAQQSPKSPEIASSEDGHRSRLSSASAGAVHCPDRRGRRPSAA